MLKRAYGELGNWRAVGHAFGISGGMAYRIVMNYYEPKEAVIRVQLGLAAMVTVAACARCGQVHVKKGCVQRAAGGKQRKNLFDWPVAKLRWALENREEMK
jgi:hypothetical protein